MKARKSARPVRKVAARPSLAPPPPPVPIAPAVPAPNLDLDLARALDPGRLFEDALGGPPDPWQARLLRGDAARTLVLCSRQSGKSSTAAALSYWTAAYAAPALVLLIAPSLRQSVELFRKILDVHRTVGGSVSVEAESALRLELRNGSRIVALPGDADTTRGFSGVRLVVVDEAARVSDGILAAVRPMLAVSRGRLIALTTPNGKRGWFYDAWQGEAGESWERIRVTAQDCPRIAPAFLDEERLALGPALFAQEYECDFREAQGQVFSEALIGSIFRADVEPLFPGSEWALPEGPVIEARRLGEARIVEDGPVPIPTFEVKP